MTYPWEINEAEWIKIAEIRTERISSSKQSCNVLIYSIIKRQNVYVECEQHKQPIDITKFLISWAPFSVNSDGHLHWYLKNRMSNSSRFSAEEASISAPTEPHHDWQATDRCSRALTGQRGRCAGDTCPETVWFHQWRFGCLCHRYRLYHLWVGTVLSGSTCKTQGVSRFNFNTNYSYSVKLVIYLLTD